MDDYTGWIVVDKYQDGLILANPDDPNDMVLLRHQVDEAQLDLVEHLASLDWVHTRDITYYHRNCSGSIFAVEAFDNKIRSSECSLCGMRIDSTLSHPSVTYPDTKARLA